MYLKEACHDILSQLEKVVISISKEDFIKPIPALNQATIGQHIRHTLEFFTCLMQSNTQGCVNYDKREHDKVIETDPMIAQGVIQQIEKFVDETNENQVVNLEVNYSLNETSNDIIVSNLFRELAYNIEHAIHHMAIIKIGLNEIAPYVTIPDHFGVAISTIKYKQQLPQT